MTAPDTNHVALPDDRRDALLPCKCGGDAQMRSSSDGDVEWLQCRRCGFESPCHYSYREAIAAWNTRTPTVSPEPFPGSTRYVVAGEVTEARVEAAARAIGLLRYAGHNPPCRWPSSPADRLPGRDGTVPLEWDFAEKCREDAHAALSAAPPGEDVMGLLREARNILQNSGAESGVCACGDPVESHTIGSGHAPVDGHVYYAASLIARIDAALAEGGRANGS